MVALGVMLAIGIAIAISFLYIIAVIQHEYEFWKKIGESIKEYLDKQK